MGGGNSCRGPCLWRRGWRWLHRFIATLLESWTLNIFSLKKTKPKQAGLHLLPSLGCWELSMSQWKMDFIPGGGFYCGSKVRMLSATWNSWSDGSRCCCFCSAGCCDYLARGELMYLTSRLCCVWIVLTRDEGSWFSLPSSRFLPSPPFSGPTLDISQKLDVIVVLFSLVSSPPALLGIPRCPQCAHPKLPPPRPTEKPWSVAGLCKRHKSSQRILSFLPITLPTEVGSESVRPGG